MGWGEGKINRKREKEDFTQCRRLLILFRFRVTQSKQQRNRSTELEGKVEKLKHVKFQALRIQQFFRQKQEFKRHIKLPVRANAETKILLEI